MYARYEVIALLCQFIDRWFEFMVARMAWNNSTLVSPLTQVTQQRSATHFTKSTNNFFTP